MKTKTRSGSRRGVRAAGLGLGLALACWTAAGAGEAPAAPDALTCTNPASGASWRIVVDYGKATVDARPAKITRSAISWYDPSDGGTYTLDRASGDLSASIASSTGGYFRYARCRLQPAR